MPRNTRYQINTTYYELFLNAIRIINEVEREFINVLQRNRAKFEYWLQYRFLELLKGTPATVNGLPLPGPFQLPGGTPWADALRNAPPTVQHPCAIVFRSPCYWGSPSGWTPDSFWRATAIHVSCHA